MERLTHPRNSGIKTGYWSPNKKDELMERLAAYEDTGVTPQEIYSLKAKTIIKALGTEWIPVEERLPENDNYILLSFSNFSLPLIGRYEADSDGGGAFYLGDNDEGDTCLSADLYVNAWMPLPKPYRTEMQLTAIKGKVDTADMIHKRITYVKPVAHHYEEVGEKPYIKYSCPVCDALNNKHQVIPGEQNCPLCKVNLDWGN